MTERILIPAVTRPPVAPVGLVQDMAGETMGTTWAVRVVTAKPDDLAPGIQAVLDKVVAEMSTWLPMSDLCRFNAAPAGTWQELPADFFTVLDYALAVAAGSDGAFDPTVGALVSLWGFGPAPPRNEPPDEAAVLTALKRGGWHKLRLDRATRRAWQPGGLQIDLSAVAKGHGVDAVSRWLLSKGLTSHMVEVGGELRGHGVKPDGTPWWVALEMPPTSNLPRTRMALHECAIATSGDYRRGFSHGNRFYPHTIDPRTGRALDNGISSVTVVHLTCMQADAMATTLTVLGWEEGYAYALRYGIAALFVRRSGASMEERMTPTMAAMLE